MEKTLAARARLINTAYLDAGDVSDRARALAAEITAGCEGDYDKLSAIAAYLRENYSYEFSSEEPPENENFLDWLLFKEREGYCAWYATAATLLARSVGIPARYVQGYRGELAGEMFTKLGADNAHAWCEGYIKGYGWVTVEATPGFSCGSDSWLTAAELDEADVDGTDAEAVPNDAVPDHEETGEEPQTPEVHPGAADEPESEPVPIQEPEPEPDRKTVPTERRRLPALIPVVLFAVLLTVPLMIRASRRRRYVKADCATKLRLDLERLLRDLRGIGYPRRSEESLRQYFARLPWYFPEDEAEAKEMVALYERTFFALIQPSEAELERHRTFAAHCTPKTGWQRFWQDKW
ncbi:MAG: DUF4129 domain-containing protein [Oscillospiraceae bacterium]|nr:DUF4129 domain-containing protein [Oscillospiraceae bacterium]